MITQTALAENALGGSNTSTTAVVGMNTFPLSTALIDGYLEVLWQITYFDTIYIPKISKQTIIVFYTVFSMLLCPTHAYLVLKKKKKSHFYETVSSSSTKSQVSPIIKTSVIPRAS